MTKQDIIIEKLDRIIQLLEGKKNNPLITFVPASEKANDKFVKDREKEIFQKLDNVK